MITFIYFFAKSSTPESNELSSLQLLFMLKHAARSMKKEIKQPNTPTKMHKPARTAAFAFLYTELNSAGCTQLHEDVLT